ncbi:hypothetical protein QTP88_001112 [Uroleucon formosanum]
MLFAMQLLLINHIVSSENQDDAFFNLTLTTNSPGLQYEILREDTQIIRQMARHSRKFQRSFESGGSALKWMFGIADADDVRSQFSIQEFHGGSSSESPLGKLITSQQLRGAKNLRGGQPIERERTSVRMSQEVQAAVL